MGHIDRHEPCRLVLYFDSFFTSIEDEHMDARRRAAAALAVRSFVSGEEATERFTDEEHAMPQRNVSYTRGRAIPPQTLLQGKGDIARPRLALASPDAFTTLFARSAGRASRPGQ